MKGKCRLWWPKQHSPCEQSSSYLLFGWFIPSSDSLDVVVAFTCTDVSLSRLQCDIKVQRSSFLTVVTSFFCSSILIEVFINSSQFVEKLNWYILNLFIAMHEGELLIMLMWDS